MAIKDEKRYVKNSPIIGKKFREFQNTTLERGVLDKKTEGVLEAGAPKEEVAEALLTATVRAVGTQLYWAKDICEKHF